ncbi:unnamed protein product [Arctogadus glacialis]
MNDPSSKHHFLFLLESRPTTVKLVQHDMSCWPRRLEWQHKSTREICPILPDVSSRGRPALLLASEGPLAAAPLPGGLLPCDDGTN